MNTFELARLKKRNKNFEKNYLLAEQMIVDIKSEHLLILKGMCKDESVYKHLIDKFYALKFDLMDYWFYEFSKRLNMSLLALDSIYGKDEESREDAKKQFGLEHEILTLLSREHGVEDIKFANEYRKEVEEE
ncbi:guanylate-binding protein [Clostridium estertheticum]|uniref:guanylate-binding protein n=1 Tax=Clostridium estertheticum TaxID=238834 RepID=UPI001C6F23FD|nr:guanylate-binding protein [Clostridium estertheticum]MBW9154077.1 guanylate-binding protein [Clostridium estertheticum]MBW9172537.1 guanylate-binding protein [Clostridium estertheticum]WLC76509.1 guanylate-binding protein [Clostridium estertheticum]WLC83456.1 guanylate-binding protein [Clostridium estertheticum]